MIYKVEHDTEPCKDSMCFYINENTVGKISYSFYTSSEECTKLKECRILNIFVEDEYIHQGYAKEMVHWFKTYIEVNHTSINRVSCQAPLKNKAIRRIFKTNGFYIEGVKRAVYNVQTSATEDFAEYVYITSNHRERSDEIMHRHYNLYNIQVFDLINEVMTYDSWEDVEEKLKDVMNIINDNTPDNRIGHEVYEDILKELKSIDDSKSESYACDIYNVEPVRVSELIRELNSCDPNGFVYLRIQNNDLSFNYTTPLKGIISCAKNKSTIGGINVDITRSNNKVNKYESCVLY
jgi:RimJ/RimL family protein N-acetyltransferase